MDNVTDDDRRTFDAVQPVITALSEISLDQLELELALTEPDVVWLAEWLSDSGAIFRLFKRHKFIRPFALRDIREIAIWRLHVLRPILLHTLPNLFHCLPPPFADPLGRPIVVLKLAILQSRQATFLKDSLLQEVERLRLHLRYIHEQHIRTDDPPLQYLLLVDLDGVCMPQYNLDLCLWILTDITPRYPGMLATVFVLNYSWIHSGAWSVVKRILPASIIRRVHFPSEAQLVNYCLASNLPADYGGLLPPLDRIDDALRSPYQTQHLPAAPSTGTLGRSSPPVNAALRRSPSTIALPPLSLRNPFFGYPAIASATSPHTIRHVKRGPRELLCTLVVLWWRRWSRWVQASVYALALVAVLRRARVGKRVLASTREWASKWARALAWASTWVWVWTRSKVRSK